jgi:molybdate transport system ATP-binding protein
MLEFDAGITLGDLQIDARFQIAQRSVTAVFGPSGAGKSTLLELTAGAKRPTRGRIRLAGRTVADAASTAHEPLQQRGLGWVFQDGKLFPHLSVRDNLLFGAHAREHAARCTPLQFDAVVDVLGLQPLLSRWPRDLSGGERQRVAIGRALLSQPQLLLLDEPLASLDAPRRREILGLLTRVRDEFGLPMLYVTHNLGEVLQIADRLLLLDRGRMLAEGPLQQLIGHIGTPVLTDRPDAGALIDTTVTAHDALRGATLLRLSEQLQLVIPLQPVPVASRIRVYVLANEIMLASAPPAAISVRNVLPATVTQLLQHRDDGSALAELAVGQHRLLAAVTGDAVREMKLARGERTYALIKSVAIDAPAGSRLLEIG